MKPLRPEREVATAGGKGGVKKQGDMELVSRSWGSVDEHISLYACMTFSMKRQKDFIKMHL